jgi:hypothetical protein
MKKLFSFLLLILVTTAVLAQQKVVYDAHAEQRTVSPFHAIKVSHGIELLIKQGSDESLAISADNNEQRDAVKTEVVNGELRIYIEQRMEKWWQQLRKKGVRVKAYVSFKNLDRIDGSSGSKTTIDGSLSGNDLSIDLSSGALLNGDITVTTLDVDQSSGAKSTMGGRVQNLEVSASSGAHFYGYNLAAEKVKANASSGGKMELSVGKEMSASASSGGAINYKGEGSVSNVSTSSGGKVRRS